MLECFSPKVQDSRALECPHPDPGMLEQASTPEGMRRRWAGTVGEQLPGAVPDAELAIGVGVLGGCVDNSTLQ